jgi:dipeptidyl aminopeptidase/acylaminoacyl peptidase
MKTVVEQMGVFDVEEINNEYPTYSFFYKSDGIKVRGFIMFPKNTQTKCPAIFVNRGGTGEHGKITSGGIVHFNFFAEAGYVVIFSQYRGCDGGEGVDRMGGDDVFDITNMYDYVCRNPYIDISRIGMWGVSRGGMMGFQVIARVPWVKAFIAVAPIIDEVAMADWRPGWRQHQIETYGGSFVEQCKRSPIRWVEHIPSIPMIIFHGAKDDRTICEKSIQMAKAVGSRMVVYPDDGHFISSKTVVDSVEFFGRHI